MKTATKTHRLKLPGITTSSEGVVNIFKDVEEKTGVIARLEAAKNNKDGGQTEAVVSLSGSPDAIKIARNMILQDCETQTNRVVLKMDITHEEHPSLIGKKGKLNKLVMDITNTLIHYPDGNIRPQTNKTNLVSITGEPCNVEKARVMLRALMTFQVTFDVDVSMLNFITTCHLLWKKIEEELGLSTHFIPYTNRIGVVLKCSQGLFPTIRHEILKLIELLSQKRGCDLPPISVYMDIMPHSHNYVKGTKGSNIERITNRTGASVLVKPGILKPGSDLHNVVITGNLDSVYMAWQEVMNSLAMTISFDVCETRETNNGATDILCDCDISVSTKAKHKYIKTVFVKGPEKYSKQILQYRQGVLNLPAIHFQSDLHLAKIAFSLQRNNSEVSYVQIAQNLNAMTSNISRASAEIKNVIDILNMKNNFQHIENNFSQTVVPNNSTLCPSLTYADVHTTDERLCELNKKYHNVPSMSDLPLHGNADLSSSILWAQNSNSLMNNNEVVVDEFKQPHEQSVSFPNSPLRDSYISSFENSFEKRLSAYQAIHRHIESTQVPSNAWAGYGFSKSMDAAFIQKQRDSFRYSSTSLNHEGSSSSDDSFSNFAIPDYFDDKICPDHVKLQDLHDSLQDLEHLQEQYKGNMIYSNEDKWSMSNVFDFKINTPLPHKFNHKDILPELLYKKGLYNYIDIFLQQEIDYSTFIHLSESDLISLGVKNYSARMKITCLIRELQEYENYSYLKTFDAAPGAERRQNRN